VSLAQLLVPAQAAHQHACGTAEDGAQQHDQHDCAQDRPAVRLGAVGFDRVEQILVRALEAGGQIVAEQRRLSGGGSSPADPDDGIVRVTSPALGKRLLLVDRG
jgi:predicted enzyme related to lactoylglutathione lyase